MSWVYNQHNDMYMASEHITYITPPDRHYNGDNNDNNNHIIIYIYIYLFRLQ